MKKARRSILGQLTRTARAERTLLAQRLGTIGLHPGQDAVLLALAGEDGISLVDLADRLGVTAPTVTKTIARLSAEGFLEKRPSPSDRRQSFAFLTEAGLAAAREVRLIRREIEDTALAGFSPRQRRRLAKLLKKAAGNLEPGPGGREA